MEQYIGDFAGIIYEALPFIVLGVVIAGLLEEFVPQQFIARIVPGNRPLAIALGCFLGLIFPMCECGIIPVMRRLLRKGLPLSLCVSYLLAGPIINVVVLTSTYFAFDPPSPSDYIFKGPVGVTLLRAGMGFLIAFNVGLLVERVSRNRIPELLAPLVVRGLSNKETQDEEKTRRTVMERLNNITGTALNDFVDIMVFLILGAALATAGRALVGQDVLGRGETPLGKFLSEQPALAILVAMALAVLFCLCSEADAFVAANFPRVMPPAAKLAFLVLGPMMDIKLYLMYTRVFRPRLIWTIIIAVVVQVFVFMLIIHVLWANWTEIQQWWQGLFPSTPGG